MRKSFYIAVAMVVIFAGLGYSGEPDNAAVVPVLTPEKKTVTLGEPIILEYEVSSNSDQIIEFYLGPQGLGNLHFEAVDKATGRTILMPKLVLWGYSSDCWSATQHVNKGRTIKRNLILGRWGAVDAPGNYSIICHVDMPGDEVKPQTKQFAKIPDCRADVEVTPFDNNVFYASYEKFITTALDNSNRQNQRTAVEALMSYPEPMAIAAMKKIISSRKEIKMYASRLMLEPFFDKEPGHIIEYYKDANDEERALIFSFVMSMRCEDNGLETKRNDLWDKIRDLPAEVHLSRCKLEMKVEQLDNESYAGGPVPIEVSFINKDKFTFYFADYMNIAEPPSWFPEFKFQTASNWEVRKNQQMIADFPVFTGQIEPNASFTFKTYLHYYFRNMTPGAHNVTLQYEIIGHHFNYGLLKKMEASFDVHLKEFNKADLDAKIDKAIAGMDCDAELQKNIDMFLFVEYPGLSRFYVSLTMKAAGDVNRYFKYRRAFFAFTNLAMRNEQALKDLVNMVVKLTDERCLQNVIGHFRTDFELGEEYIKQMKESGNAALIKCLDEYLARVARWKQFKEKQSKEKRNP
jgi:hypothetical protein